MSRPELHRGKLAKHPRILSVRALVRDDLAVLREKRVGPPRIKNIRRTHHRVCRYIAAGFSDAEITRLTGYTATRIGQLKVDPATSQLITEYAAKQDEREAGRIDEVLERIVEAKIRTLDKILDHYDDDDESEEKIPLKTLLPIFGEMADRSGHGKHHTVRNEHVDFAAMLKERSLRLGRSTVIDAKPVVQTIESPTPLADPGFRRRV